MTAVSSFHRTLPDGTLISAASFGCSSLWAKPSFDANTAIALLETGVRAGLNYLDTGPSYGNGEGEKRLGAFLSVHGRSGLIVSTKVGTSFDSAHRRTRSFSVPDMEKSLGDSLARLRLPQVDILYLHGPSTADLNDDTLRFFEEEKRRGRIRWSGVNSFDVNVLEACIDRPIDALMIQYNVADLSAEPLLPQFAERKKIVISGTALARAIYAPRTFIPTNRLALWYLLRAFKSDPWFPVKGAQLRKRLELFGEDAASAAMQFVVGSPFIHSAIFGTTKNSHMLANIEAARHPMPDEQRCIFYRRR